MENQGNKNQGINQVVLNSLHQPKVFHTYPYTKFQILSKKGAITLTHSRKDKQPNQPLKGSKKVKNRNHSRQKKHASHDM